MPVTNNRYYIAETYEDNLHTASVIRKDNEKILQQLGFRPLKFRHVKEGSAIVKLQRLGEMTKLALSVKKGDTVVFHFPLLATAYKVLFELLNRKGAITIALVIDIDGLRYQNQELLTRELAQLKLFTHIIAHNTSMKAFLAEYISEMKISCIDVFDYPATATSRHPLLSYPVCFAGNLEKAAFVNELSEIENIDFNVYGPSFTPGGQKNVFYKGSFPSHELPGILEGSFGLVWDGGSTDSCDGYLQYNNPYKLSLYLAAGLPLIVWEKSAAAQFVQQYQVGIMVNSLHDIENRISNISGAQYESMKQHIIPLKEKMGKGYFLKKAIGALLFKVIV